MPLQSDKVRENVELDENWRPKSGEGRARRAHPGAPIKSAKTGFLAGLLEGIVDMLEELFEALFPVWILLFFAAIVVAMVAILYYLCEVLPKH
jgi:hypothetical protein